MPLQLMAAVFGSGILQCFLDELGVVPANQQILLGGGVNIVVVPALVFHERCRPLAGGIIGIQKSLHQSHDYLVATLFIGKEKCGLALLHGIHGHANHCRCLASVCPCSNV